MRKIIDLETYPRRSHYEFFKAMAYPYVGLTANVEVTRLVQYAKDHQGSTFLACLWAAANAANAVPELRQRIVDDRIVEYEHCDTAHTVALVDHTFCNCRTDCRRSLEDFLVYGKQCQQQASHTHGFAATVSDETGLIFLSCVPWVAFTQVIQPAPIPADTNPRIVFGKFVREEDKVVMPLHIQCNHALVDGYHIARFYEEFSKIENSL